jgi:thiosulfate reductase cytochrome b subunit
VACAYTGVLVPLRPQARRVKSKKSIRRRRRAPALRQFCVEQELPMPQTAQAAASANRAAPRRVHPLPVRIMHWINALAIFIMIGSGWKIYNDDILFSFLRFPDAIVIGKWAQYGLQWHFFGMWIFVLNGIAYLCYGIISGRFWRKLFPISPREVLVTMGEALRFRLRHDDLTHYNAVQKVLYLGVMAVGVLIVISGLALWKPVQFSELANLFGNFQTIRLVHFLCMTAIVTFIVVHVTLALLVPQSLLAIITGGPALDQPLDVAPRAAAPVIAEIKAIPEIKTVPQIETIPEM